MYTKFIALLSLSFCLVVPLAANSVVWENATASDFNKGTLVNTMLFADGSVRDGGRFRQLATQESTVWSSACDNTGTLYFGTGVKGAIYRLAAGKLEKYCDTGELIVTSLVSLGNTLYAATIAEGKLFQIEDGKPSLVAQLPSSYIWAMKAWQGQLYLAGGAEGTLYQFDPAGKQVKIVARTPEKHLLSLEIDTYGNLYAGSAPNGLLYRITRDGQMSVLVDLAENEIRSLCWSAGRLYLAANSARGFDNARAVQALARNIQEQGYKGKLVDRKKIWEEMMSASLYQYQENRGFEKLWELPKNFVTAVAPATPGVFLATGLEGRVYHIQSTDTWAIHVDLREEQIMAIAAQEGRLTHYATGDSGMVHVRETVTPGETYYLSEVHDSETFAQWGHIQFRASGSLTLQTRSGNTLKPDELWSSWSAPIDKSQSPVTSPAGRYFQYKVVWQQAGGVLESVRLFYRRQNRTPQIKNFKIAFVSGANPRKLLAEKPANPVQLSWEAKDPDNDSLRYRLFYKNVQGSVWYELTANQVCTISNFKWDLARVADGYYLIRLDVSDEMDNPTPAIATQVSAPALIDNNAPLLLAQVEGDSVRGNARDSFSPVAQLAYRIEGSGDWTLIDSRDGIFDECEEEFLIPLPAAMARPYNMEIRALDAAGNSGNLFFQVK